MTALTKLEESVSRVEDVTESAILLLDGLKEKLDAAIAGGSMEEVEALSNALGVSSTSLADAVARNTPAQPTPFEPPVEPV